MFGEVWVMSKRNKQKAVFNICKQTLTDCFQQVCDALVTPSSILFWFRLLTNCAYTLNFLTNIRCLISLENIFQS